MSFYPAFRNIFCGKLGFPSIGQYWIDPKLAVDSKIQSGENGSIKEITLKCNGLWGQYGSAVKIDEDGDGENICDEDYPSSVMKMVIFVMMMM